MPLRRPLLPLLLLLVSSTAAGAQLPGLTSASPAPVTKQEPALPPDPLGRETPRGALLGFIKAAQDERYNIAIRYFQPPPNRRRHSEDDEEELAAQLLTILN